ncbi:MAG: twin-arginine translocase subunit TatC [Anaerolineales bacterium]|jgi:sec-independent protein translocase protein TatC|nr:twin-arginine translocase subunit TatC [Anaerolineales bacterium]
MRRFFSGTWRVITFPFRLVFNIVAYPFRAVYRFFKFLNTEPDERPLPEIFVDITTQKETRDALWEQVEALRFHLLRSVLALAAFVIAAFWVAEPAMSFLAAPVGGLDKLQAIQVTEELGVFMRVAMMLGIAAAFPYIALEFWAFAAPGLKPREKKMALMGIPVGYLLFISGMAFTFYVLLPAALPFLGGFTKIAEFWAAREYFTFITGLMLWIGLFFEFPLVIFVLTSIGLVQPKFLAEQWRLAVVIIAVLAAAITPTVDPVNMGLVMLPMIMLYFISIGLSYIAHAGRRKQQAAAEASARETEPGFG